MAKTEKAGACATISLDPIMVTREQAAALCGVGTTLWDELTDAGKNPTPRRLGRRVLWLKEELVAWCRAGCPSREKWNMMTQVEKVPKI